MLFEAGQSLPYLHAEAVKELQAVLEREIQRLMIDSIQRADGVDKAYSAIARLTPQERLLLVRYLKREVATTFEKHVYIVHDIVHHPVVVQSAELARIEQRIKAEKIRRDGILPDVSEETKAARCQQSYVLMELEHQRANALYEHRVRQIETSSISPERQRQQKEHAAHDRDQSKNTSSTAAKIGCGDMAAKFEMQPAAASREPASRREDLFTLYSLTPPATLPIAEVASMPPVKTSLQDGLKAGKIAQKRQVQTTQHELDQVRRKPEQQAYDETTHAMRLFTEEGKAVLMQYDKDLKELARRRNASDEEITERRNAIDQTVNKIKQEVENGACSPKLTQESRI